MSGVLDSIRIIEISEALAGPYCAMLLGDFGADVIKVERRLTGDHARGWGPPFVQNESAYFLAANRNKRSLTLDYNKPPGLEILHQLLSTADILVINQPSLPSLQKRGLDPDTLLARYPRLIYCAISGYGHLSTPKAGLPGYDILAQAEAGVMSFTGEPDAGPVRYPVAIADMSCGIYGVIAILVALLAREKSGRGQLIDMALFDSQLTWLINIGSNFLNAGEHPQRWGNAHPSIVPYDAFVGSDGRHFAVGVGTEAAWSRFLAVLGAETTLGQDSRFVTNASRTEHRSELLPVLREKFAQQPSTWWLDHFRDAQIPAAAIQNVAEALNDVQTASRNLIVEVDHPLLGIAKSIANPARLCSTPPSYRLPPPLLGEHTDSILASLGCSKHLIKQLREDCAI